MATERSPLYSQREPSYTLIGSDGEATWPKLKKCQCCICGALIALLTIALITVLALYLTSQYKPVMFSAENVTTNTTEVYVTTTEAENASSVARFDCKITCK